MTGADLFLSFSGRVDRRRWCRAVAVLVGLVLATFLVTWRLDEMGVIGPYGRDGARLFVQTAVMVPWLALDYKRFQDLNRPGLLAAICPGLYVMSRLLDWPGLESPRALTVTVSFLQLAVALWLACVLPFIGGTPGPNRYGADPLRPDVPEPEQPAPSSPSSPT